MELQNITLNKVQIKLPVEENITGAMNERIVKTRMSQTMGVAGLVEQLVALHKEGLDIEVVVTAKEPKE